MSAFGGKADIAPMRSNVRFWWNGAKMPASIATTNPNDGEFEWKSQSLVPTGGARARVFQGVLFELNEFCRECPLLAQSGHSSGAPLWSLVDMYRARGVTRRTYNMCDRFLAGHRTVSAVW